MKVLLTQEQIIKGMQLAYLLSSDKKKTLEISATALLSLEAERIKEKRWFRDDLKLLLEKLGNLFSQEYFYSPKIHLEEPQIYQKLIMKLSDEAERQQEIITPVSEKLLIVRYLNYIILNGLDKKTFLCLATSFSRVLHNYTTADTVKICLFLYPNYKNVKNLDNQIKKAKANLLKQLEERFYGAISVVDNRLEAKSLSNLPNIQLLTELINNSLEQLVLWETRCFTSLSTFNILEPQNILLAGQQMSHLIIHPNCYGKLTDELKLDSPKVKLEIPKFFTNNRIDKENDPFDPPDFTDDIPKVLEAVQKHFDEVKQSRPNQLAIYIDYKKRGIINLHQTNKFFLKLINEGNQLEIYDEETNLFLLSRRLISDIFLEKPETTVVTIPIQNGQNFKLIIKYIPPTIDDEENFDENNYEDIETGTFEISISCHETSIKRALYWSFRRLLYEFNFSPLMVFSRVTITFILLALLGLLAIYPDNLFSLLNHKETIVERHSTPIIKPIPQPNISPTPEPQKQEVPNKNNYKPNKLKPKAEPKIAPAPIEPILEQESEQIAKRGNNAALATIKNIYVSDLIDVELRKELTQALKANGFNVIENPASTLVEGQLEYALPETTSIILSINNKTVFEKALDKLSLKEQALSIVSNLIDAIEKAKTDKKQP